MNWRTGATLALLALSFVASAATYASLPEVIPSHWNIRGEVDGTMPRALGAFFVPVLASAVYALLLALPRIDPLRRNYSAFSEGYRSLVLGIVAFLVYLHAFTLAWALGYELPVSSVMAIGFGALFILLGRILQRTEPTWFVGIRTPWTLSNADVWHETHRFGARAFTILGALVLLSAILPPTWTFIVTIGGAVSVALATTIYSYVSYRRLVDRTAP